MIRSVFSWLIVCLALLAGGSSTTLAAGDQAQAAAATQPAPVMATALAEVRTLSTADGLAVAIVGNGVLRVSKVGVLEATADRPYRLYFDFRGVSTGTAAAATMVRAGGVTAIRVALNSLKPVTTRVVIELAERTGYRMEAGPAEIRVVLARPNLTADSGTPPPSQAAPPPAAPVAPAQAPAPPAATPPAATPPPYQEPAVTRQLTPAPSGSGAPQEVGVVTAVIGSGLRLTWPQPSERIAIADDTLAKLHVVSSREVVVNGLKAGRTTIFIWLANGRQLFYRLVVEPNLEQARRALRDVAPYIILELGPEPDSVVLRGEVPNESTALRARAVVDQLLGRPKGDKAPPLRIINLLRYPGVLGGIEDRLSSAMAAIDPRIRIRRVQTGSEADSATDSYILEGEVRDVNAMVQAVILADRQLGGNGKTVKAADESRVAFNRGQSSMSGGVEPGEPPRSGLSAQLARGLLITSESGRVVSFLKVDSLPQVMVAIRVLEIDRSKARRLGVNFRLDSTNFSVGSFTVPGTGALPDARGKTSGSLPGLGNVVGTFVNGTMGLAAALDMLSEKQIGRSVAEPNILTLSGEQASVMVGGEIPIPGAITSQGNVESGFSFQQFGVRLDIRPTVGDDGKIALEVAPSIVNPSLTLGNGDVPGFTIQRVETTAVVGAGESLVLGGLLTSKDSLEERGIPVLQNFPLFRWQRKVTQNTELLFLITPRIIEPGSQAAVKMPPLEYQDSPIKEGVTGLDDSGVPYSFSGSAAKTSGKDGVCIEMRAGPDFNAPLVDCLVPGTSLVMLDMGSPWRHVLTPGGAKGWAQTDRLVMTKDKPLP